MQQYRTVEGAANERVQLGVQVEKHLHPGLRQDGGDRCAVAVGEAEIEIAGIVFGRGKGVGDK